MTQSPDCGDSATSKERPDPEDDPFACSICGCYIGELKRIKGEPCDACLADMGFDVEGYR